MQSIFSERSFASVMRAGDAFQFDIDLKKDRDKIIQDASKAALSGSIDLTKFNSSFVNNKPCITYGDYTTHLLLRSLTRHLRRRARIRTYGRDQIVRGVIETLLDATPMHCIRRDITSLYETLPIEPIRDRLIYDTTSSTLARNYIKQFFDTHCAKTQYIGLPRGIGLSALLAEMAMRDFDQSVRSQAGVFKYYRFSDDIIVFTMADPSTLEQYMKNSLPGVMQFNLSKSKTYELAKSGGPSSADLEYLGYLFRTTNLKPRADSREVRVAIASKKIKRLKTRIILSLNDMTKTVRRQVF